MFIHNLLSGLFQQGTSKASQLLAHATTTGYAVVLGVVLLGSITLATWHFLRFTIIPSVYYDDPKELPYWTPGKVPPPFHIVLQNTNYTVSSR